MPPLPRGHLDLAEKGGVVSPADVAPPSPVAGVVKGAHGIFERLLCLSSRETNTKERERGVKLPGPRPLPVAATRARSYLKDRGPKALKSQEPCLGSRACLARPMAHAVGAVPAAAIAAIAPAAEAAGASAVGKGRAPPERGPEVRKDVHLGWGRRPEDVLLEKGQRDGRGAELTGEEDGNGGGPPPPPRHTRRRRSGPSEGSAPGVGVLREDGVVDTDLCGKPPHHHHHNHQPPPQKRTLGKPFVSKSFGNFLPRCIFGTPIKKELAQPHLTLVSKS